MLYPNRVRTHFSYLHSNITSYSKTPCVFADYNSMGAITQGTGFVGREKDGTLRIPRNERGYANICNPNSEVDLDNEVVITVKSNVPATYFGICKYPEGGNVFLDEFLSTKLPLIPFNEALYQSEADFESYQLLTSIQDLPVRRGRHILSPEEYRLKFQEYPGALQNLERLFSEELKWKPTSRQSLIADTSPEHRTKLRELCEESLVKMGLDTKKVYTDRLERELDVINSLRYNNYFLMAFLIVKKSRERGILIGPGRGSAAGSLVVFLLEITKVDPIKFDLIFERFLNPFRVSPPDIDIDFQDTRRSEVIQIIKDLFGETAVSFIPTFQSLKSKSAFNEAAKYACNKKGVIDEKTLKELLSLEFPKEVKIDEMLDNKTFIKNAPKGTWDVLRMARDIEDVYRHESLHPSGIVVCPLGSSVWDYAPVTQKETGELVTHFDCTDTEKFSGLLKMDVLGLKSLSIIGDIEERIKNKEPRVIKSKLTDKVTMQGVFQYESIGMSNFVYDIKPQTIIGLANISALYRPGPMQWLPIYTQKIKGDQVTSNPVYEAVIDICNKNKEIYNVLKPTQFIPIYQEQIIHIITNFAGFTAAEADVLRQAIGKKKPEVLRDAEKNFVERAVKNGKSRPIAETVFNKVILPFQGYGFNKSHAVSYAGLSARMIKLKKKYPFDFIASCISFQKKTKDMRKFLIDAISYGGIVCPPAKSKSGLYCTVEDNILYVGLLSIMGLGEGSKNSLDVLVKNNNWSYQEIINQIADNPKIQLRANEFHILFASGYFDEEPNKEYYKRNVNNVFCAVTSHHSKLKRGVPLQRNINVDTIPADDCIDNRFTKLDVLGFDFRFYKSAFEASKKTRIGYIDWVGREVTQVHSISYLNPKTYKLKIKNPKLGSSQIKKHGIAIIDLKSKEVLDF